MISRATRTIKGQEFTLLTLDSEKSGNSIGETEAKELQWQLKNFKGEGLLLTNSGTRFFCTGGNLTEQIKSNRASSLKVQKLVRENLKIISNLTVPTAAVLKGDAFGGGTELLSVFDYVLALPHVQIGVWQRKLGLTFGWGGGERLLGRLGSKKFRQSFLSAKVFSAYEAERTGLIDGISPAATIDERAWSWLATTAELPIESFKVFRKWTPSTELKIFESLWFKKDHLEALKRF